MNIEVKEDKKYNEPKIVIYTDKINEEISNLIEEIAYINHKTLKAYKDKEMYILNQKEIETIFIENSKVYAKYNNKVYVIKKRLYELEELLDRKIFERISNSEIANFNLVESIDFKIIGTLVLNFKSGNKSYVSRRYIPKIKKFLEL